MKPAIARAYLVLCYYLSWLWFGLFGCAYSALCCVVLVTPFRRSLQRPVRRGLRLLMGLWQSWLCASGVVRVRWVGFGSGLTGGTAFLANHPTLIDAPFLLARLPDPLCVMKPSLARNPLVAPVAMAAGYIFSDKPLDAVREVGDRLRQGSSLLLFPEGTRTAPGACPGALKSAFFASLERGHAPVQLILIRSSPELMTKGRAWWRPPAQLPGEFVASRDERWEWTAGRSAGEIMADIQRRMREALGPEAAA